MREQISKKQRFDIFKRDMFQCQYCGSCSPKVVLEVDHIIPVVEGGKNSIDNLITSCFDCNRGKGKHSLTTVPKTVVEKHAELSEREAQYKAFVRLQNKIRERENMEILRVDDIYNDHFPEYSLSESFKRGSVKKFITEMGANEVADAMHKACMKVNHSSGAIKYFCGICWNIIKDKGL